MVQDKKARSGHIIDNGSASRGASYSKRSTDKSNQGLPSARQVQSQINYRVKASLRKLNSAVLVQAVKDLCNGKQASADKIMAWTKTDMFREVCGIAGFDHAKISLKMRNIADMPLRIRPDLLFNIFKDFRSGEFSDADTGGGGEAERKG